MIALDVAADRRVKVGVSAERAGLERLTPVGIGQRQRDAARNLFDNNTPMLAAELEPLGGARLFVAVAGDDRADRSTSQRERQVDAVENRARRHTAGIGAEPLDRAAIPREQVEMVRQERGEDDVRRARDSSRRRGIADAEQRRSAAGRSDLRRGVGASRYPKAKRRL